MNSTTNAARRSNLSARETNAFDRLDAMTVGNTTTIGGVVVTRWSLEMFELDTHGKCSERIDEAAISIAARADMAA
jgi:hypothetical protein